MITEGDIFKCLDAIYVYIIKYSILSRYIRCIIMYHVLFFSQHPLIVRTTLRRMSRVQFPSEARNFFLRLNFTGLTQPRGDNDNITYILFSGLTFVLLEVIGFLN